MAAPTQELPPWYTLWTTTLTNNLGEPTETATTLLYLPLTYYGPSIPLNPDWTYGGLSPPASVPTEGPQPPVPSTSGPTTLTSLSSAIPTSQPSAIPSSSNNNIPSTTDNNIPSSTLPSASPSASVPPFDSATLSTKNRNIAIIVGTIFGFLFLVCVACLLFCWLTRYRRRDASTHSRLSDEDYHDVIPPSLRNEPRELGDGSPRHSGEEADPFLRPHSREMLEVRPRIGFMPDTNIMRDSLSSNPRTLNTLTNTSTTGSGYGNVIPSPYSNEPFEVIQRLHAQQQQPPQGQQQRGHILSPDDIRRISNENVSHGPWSAMSPHALPIPPAIRAQPPSESHHDHDDDDDSSPLIPPPPPPASYRPNSATPSSRTTLDQEQGELLTATSHRIQVGQPTIRALPPQPRSGPSSWKEKLPFFKDNSSSLSSKRSKGSVNVSIENASSGQNPSSLQDTTSYQLLESELDTSMNSANRRSISMVAVSSNSRPVSGVSGHSGGTIYYDARSTPDNSERSVKGGQSGRGTPVGVNELGAIAPLPRAARSSSPLHPHHHHSSSRGKGDIPPVPPIPAQYEHHGDVLDAPVPSAVSFRPPTTTRPVDAKMASTKFPFRPPGLGLGSPDAAVTSGAPAATMPGALVDVLEDEPPRAGLAFTAMSARSTFTRYISPLVPRTSPTTLEHDVPPPPPPKVQARSTGSGHLSPYEFGHARATLHSSGSSRGTYGSSLAHSGSVDSQGQIRRDRHHHHHMSSSTSGGYRGPISPALSAFGNGMSSGQSTPSPVPTPPPPSHLPTGGRSSLKSRLTVKSDTDMVDGAYHGSSSATSTSALTMTTRTMGESTSLGTDRDSETLVTPESLRGGDEFPDVPWAGGLDVDWKPVSPTSATFPRW